MIEINITDEIFNSAVERSKEMGALSNSITKGKGNIAGFIGETVVAHHLGVTLNNTYDYDLIYNGEKIDVKTKRTTVTPKPFYDCSVADYNPNQVCDAYIFVRVMNNYSKAWILGYSTKVDYFKKSTLLTRGMADPSNDFIVIADCHNIRISDLSEIPERTTVI